MEAELKFEREERSGVIAVGSYLFDSARRLGVKLENECGRQGECDSCSVTVKNGGELLSKLTKAEIEHLSEKRRKAGERLACQAKIEKSGEVVIMTKEKKVDEKPEAEKNAEGFRKDFEQMPLDKKISSLLDLEMIALSETISYIFNSPYEVAGKIMDVMANFGRKMEDDSNEAKRPEEHKSNGKAPKAEKPAAKPKVAKSTKKKASPKKKAPAKKTATPKKSDKSDTATS